MSIELMLRRTSASGPLSPARLDAELTKIAAANGLRAAMRGHVLRIARALDVGDDASAGFALRFERQGAEVRCVARGPSLALLQWAMQALASAIGCDAVPAAETPASALRDAATRYLEAYEREVLAERAAPAPHADEAGARFVAWLAREEHVALADDGDVGTLPMTDPAALYEALMESDAVDEVFVGETELTALAARWRAFRGATR